MNNLRPNLNNPGKHIIGVTGGDPAGIGPEIFLKALPHLRRIRSAVPLFIGDASLLKKNSSWPVGKNSAVCGRASFRYVEEGVSLWKKGKISALVTLPISKKAWHLAGKKYPGHTELLRDLLGEKDSIMIMLAGHIRAVLVTTHVPLAEVPRLLTPELIVRKTRAGTDFLRHLGICAPVIGITALNPHGGEAGVLGGEEKTVIKPAMTVLRKEGLRCVGPVPADVIFRLAREKKIDLIVSMYHDQALIPLKTFYSKKLVNYTAGIPMIRTSPGHGTGFDIAGLGKADPSSFIAAYEFALEMAERRLTRPC